MDHDYPLLHRRALAQTRSLVAGVNSDHWNLPTPCDDWNVRELLNHLVAGNFWVAPLVGGQSIEAVGTRLDGDVLGDDHVAAYEASAAESDTAFSGDGAMAAPCAVSYGPVPGSVYASHRFIDVLVHGWDLAKATGQDTTLDPELVAACREIIEPELETFEASGAFGKNQHIGDAADMQTRLLGALGRQA